MMASAREKTIAPYGTWETPVTADLLTQKNVSFGEIVVLKVADGHADVAYVENRPQEGGRAALLSRRIPLRETSAQDAMKAHEIELSTSDLNVRSGVHEYGGGALASNLAGGAIFTDYKTFSVFTVSADGKALTKVTSDNPAFRFADFSQHPTLPYIAAVLEDHTIDEPSKVINSIIVLDTKTNAVHTIASGRDFYTSPRFSPDGRHIAWVSWDHPSMPFWGSETWVAQFKQGDTARDAPEAVCATKIAGDNVKEVANYPLWVSEHTLLFSSDRSGYANPYTVDVHGDDGTLRLSKQNSVLKQPIEADFTSPAWQLNLSTYVQLSPQWLACVLASKGFSSLALLDLDSGELRRLDTPFVSIGQLRAIDASTIVFTGVQETEPSALVLMKLDEILAAQSKRDGPAWQILKRSSDVIADGIVPAGYLGKAQATQYPTTLPDGSKATAYALLFPPSNPKYAAPAGSAPPCILKIHGGPTSCAAPGASLATSYWTSRGYSICQVNYGGSTSYGREYMERLNGQWGVVDVRDAAAAASYLGTADTSADKEAVATRRISPSAQSELATLEEEHVPGGGVTFALTRPSSTYAVMQDTILASIVGGGAMMFGLPFAFPFFAALFAASAAKVQREAVTVMPGIGLQVSIERGISLPFLKKGRMSRSKPLIVSSSSKLIPRDRILDVFTKEAIDRWRIHDYLVVAVSESSNAGEEKRDADAARDASLVTLFPHLKPRLAVVEHMYCSIYPSLFVGTSTAVAHKKKESRVDPERIAISGGSAGGFTVLASLCLYPSVFKAGTSLYGVSRIAGLAESSHKFESEYVNRLMGGAPDEIPQIYHDRSPLYMADRIKSPVLLMQGDIDRVVPPEQSEAIYKVLQEQGVKSKYLVFEGEGHGFRKAENIKKSLEEEEAWYRDVFRL